ncbi:MULTISPECIES: hydantoinase/oxoprolinase family protein [unclassified Caballeronia]|uniref:hydantoinase/oxoprolinase family protein n=1 Tax=unclassified Caballeronia TaxID=2646786 RepID=UPI00285FD89F|nr:MULTISPECIES: hydantoinase/oxoprolinase family protein [unclassified Caballeronia]MDR5741383.1 hydantoinase/oxoprolinase family protein [Caballeronia sp. LZ016]MDR5807280.1 hydantoinase/oxoprolinase family protein [Caballeronia sp. LZ019]
MKRIGIDVGGTFTDVVMVDDETGRIWSTKVPTTPKDRVIGTVEGFRKILELSGAASTDVSFLGHGTTMATNMVVEGTGAKTALVTTHGFRDILELRRVSRHDRADLYDLLFDNPRPLVERRWRLEVTERMRYDGTVATPLDHAELERIAAQIRESDVEAVAVCLLHAHVNPQHEREAVDALRRLLPDRFICASHEVNPEAMEYERASSTVINAMLGPVCGRYIGRLINALAQLGFAGKFLFMQSNGGLASPAMVADRPIVLLESGPAGGVSAAIRNCEKSELKNAILGDMGGTTFDVSLIRDFRPELRNKSVLHTYTVRSPSIDIDSVGAGGGSIVWIDAGGGVRIGPESAAADPGPACYGRGGTRPTVTDCNLVLGYIDPDSFLGGEFKLDAKAAWRVVDEVIARPLGLSVPEAAQVVRSVANALMAQAIRIMTVERGYDPREFSYICYGGAGPVHAVDLAQEMGIRRVVIPPLPGLFSAFGMTVADQQYDYQRPLESDLAKIDDATLSGALDDLRAQGMEELQRHGVDAQGVKAVRLADCRYAGQPDVITVEVPDDTQGVCDALAANFEAAHLRQWNFVSKDKPIVVANVRLQLVTSTGWRGSAAQKNGGATPAPTRTRDVYFDGNVRTLPVFARTEIPVGASIEGPAVIEEHSSCAVLKASHVARVDRDLNLVIELAA